MKKLPPDSPPVLLWARLLACLDRRDAPPIERAYHLALLSHDGQVRDGTRVPYITHPLRVALILAEEMARCEAHLICAALLHDVLEESDVTPEEIERACGTFVVEAVRLLTKHPAGDEQKAARDEAYYARIASGSSLAQLVKCADRLDNLRSMRDLNDLERLARYVDETRHYILPLAAATAPYLYHALLEQCDVTPSTV